MGSRLTKEEREAERKRAAYEVVADLKQCSERNADIADVHGPSRVRFLERARLYRLALRAVREEVRRGK